MLFLAVAALIMPAIYALVEWWRPAADRRRDRQLRLGPRGALDRRGDRPRLHVPRRARVLASHPQGPLQPAADERERGSTVTGPTAGPSRSRSRCWRSPAPPSASSPRSSSARSPRRPSPSASRSSSSGSSSSPSSATPPSTGSRSSLRRRTRWTSLSTSRSAPPRRSPCSWRRSSSCLVRPRPQPDAPRLQRLRARRVLVAVLIANYVTQEGESNWFEGVQLLAVYLVLALAFLYA